MAKHKFQWKRQRGTFAEVLTAAIKDITDHGFDTMERIDRWIGELKAAAERSLVSEAKMELMLRNALGDIYKRMVERGGIAKHHVGADRFTLDRVKPQLRAELDRRILASANLIKLNRTAAIEKTLQRFQGWSTSIPAGGTYAANKRKVRTEARKALASLPFEERRVLIDQGHKLTAAISEIVATDGGAIAGRWRSNWRQINYNYREDHKDRDDKIYLVRNSWAHKAGLVRKGKAGFYDEVTAVGEEIFCRCFMTWIYSLHDLPNDMVTVKGRAKLNAYVRSDDQVIQENSFEQWINENIFNETESEVAMPFDVWNGPLITGIATCDTDPEFRFSVANKQEREVMPSVARCDIANKTPPRRSSSSGEARLLSKDAAAYTDGPVSIEPCVECSMFVHGGNAADENECTAVAGKIKAAGHCKLWERKVSNDGELHHLRDLPKTCHASLMATARAWDHDVLHYMRGIKKVDVSSTMSKWHAEYVPDGDKIVLHLKFFDESASEQVHIVLHEAGHRGQNVDKETYKAFKKAHLHRISDFEHMANKVHLEDYRRAGKVDGGLVDEVFAESYARAMLGLDMPDELAQFWRARTAHSAS